MSAFIYIEGGASGPKSDGSSSKNLTIACQQAFHRLLDKMGFAGRKPRLVACGGREKVYDRFCTQHATSNAGYVAMLIDSEEPVANFEQTWAHLKTRDNWDKPEGATDEQVLFMTTCMETWIVADRATLKKHYGPKLQENALPPTHDLEFRSRTDMHDKLAHATRDCPNAYRKGKRSFIILGELNPTALEPLLPSFARTKRILESKL